MLELYFQGWFQLRLARDPDPSDEKRGISGAAFATVDEPDLDRIIRLNEPVAPRGAYLLPGHQVPEVGVTVKSVCLDGKNEETHPLVGARVDLLENAKFESLNAVFCPPGNEPIDPFHICVSQGSLRLSRQDLWDPARPNLTLYDVDATLLKRRQPVSSEVLNVDVREATGISDAAGYVKQRRLDLQAAIDAKANATAPSVAHASPALDLQIAGLKQRLAALTIPAELTPIFESQIDVPSAQALDARQAQPEILLSQLPQANGLVTEFGNWSTKFSEQTTFSAGSDPSNESAEGSAAPYSVYWKIKDPKHWGNPSIGKQPKFNAGQLDCMLCLPGEFRIEKLLQRGGEYAIVAFHQTEVWQSKVYKLLLGSRFNYQLDIQGPAQIAGDFGVVIDENMPWPISFWMGAWDNDALSGYMKGCLQVPVKA